MNRKEALQKISILLGTTFISLDFYSCQPNQDEHTHSTIDFSQNDIMLFDNIADTIIPRTDTPGAKDAKVGSFIAVMIGTYYTENYQTLFLEGIRQIQEYSERKYQSSFSGCLPADRLSILYYFRKLSKKPGSIEKEHEVGQFFDLLMELVLIGYFTSEKGATQQLNFDPIPGKFEGCIPYQYGTKAWAL